MDFTAIVSDNIKRLNLLDKTRTHIVAVSGGADSVALLLVLHDLGFRLEVAHCNFHLRQAESDRDECFVRTLCNNLNIPFHLVHFDTTGYASLHKMSIELAARKLRYSYFETLRQDIAAADICVAHHYDDSVETVLMNLVRGTGVHGLTGIRPVNGNIKRPLLCVSRSDIEDFLRLKNQDYVTDSTNLKDEATRNKFRLNVIPMLKSINPKASENIRRTAEYMAEAVKVFDDAISKGKKRVVCKAQKDVYLEIGIQELLEEPSPEYLLHEILADYGFTASQTEQVFAGMTSQPGKLFKSEAFDLLIDRKHIIVERRQEAFNRLCIPQCGVYILSETCKMRVEQTVVDERFVLSRDKNRVCLDSSKVEFPLVLRTVSAGDRFVPFGMRGSKLVSDYLTDKKKTLFQKRKQLVVTDASGAVIWLVNERPDARCCISDKTEEAVVITMEEKMEDVRRGG